MAGHRLVFLSYPVDQAGTVGRLSFEPVLNRVKEELELRGVGYYDAGQAVNTGVLPPGDEARKIHHRAQSLCTGTLALLPPGVPTIGVPLEIGKAVTGWGMPCAVIGGDKSWALPPGVQRTAWPTETADDIWSAAAFAVGWLLKQPVAYYGDRGTSELKFEMTAPPLGVPDDTRLPQLPTRAYPDDAGLDLYVSERTVVPAHDFRDIPTGVAVELPAHAWGYLTGRSSTLRNLGLLVNPGVIDAGYRGELYAGVWNLTGGDVVVDLGSRLAQLIILNNETRHHLPVWGELGSHDRGTQGFGSSGR